MKLSPEQIEYLYQFTRQHYVEFYDLQTELVDHLANAIEEQWQENPKLSFEEALRIEFKKFGVFGFMDVIEKRKGALNTKYQKLVWHQLKTFFSIPKIIGTAAAMWIVFYSMQAFQDGVEIMQFLFIGLILVFIIGLSVLTRKAKKMNRKTEKKWLLKEIIFGYGSMAGMVNIPIQIALHLPGTHYSVWTLGFFSFLLVAMALNIYVMLFLIPSQADDYLKATYPEYAMIESL